MIRVADNYCQIDTKNTSYLFRITARGDAEHLYYGAKIPFDDREGVAERRSRLLVNTLYPEGDESYGIDGMRYEYSFSERGDIRASSLSLSDESGKTFDFVFDGFRIDDAPKPSAMPLPRGEDDRVCVVLKDAQRDVFVELWYFVYEESDVIARNTVVHNAAERPLTLHKIASAQLDLAAADKEIITFPGAWGRERHKTAQPLTSGRLSFGSPGGALSGVECNPFFIVRGKGGTESCGDTFAFNLCYSGAHKIVAETDSYGACRILNGIADASLDYRVDGGARLTTPVAVMTFSEHGTNGVSQNMHRFVRQSVLRNPPTAPVMLNSWEAMYFDLSEDKILNLSRRAAECGFDGLVIDDGWFGARDDDHSSLGDWFENRKKFPDGIRITADKVKKNGLLFGIWLEPEMLSEDSDLYRAHPDWAILEKGVRRVTGRNQYVLDLTKQEVRDYVAACLHRAIDEYGADYIKWDCNRRICEAAGNLEAYSYDYVAALYGILDEITKRHPDVIIEACASGGGRFDLGMFFYAPFAWTSDNTDPLSRVEIQEGTGYGYPICATLNHISASPSHQTKRESRFDTRRDTAAFGVLGVQQDIARADFTDFTAMRAAIADYKRNRDWLLTATQYRLADGVDGNDAAWLFLSEDGSKGRLFLYKKRFYPVGGRETVRLQGLEEGAVYAVRGGGIDVRLHGATLMRCGLTLPQNYQGTGEVGYGRTDNSTLVIEIEKIRR